MDGWMDGWMKKLSNNMNTAYRDVSAWKKQKKVAFQSKT